MANTPDYRLKALLTQHGVGDTPSDGMAAWEAFKCFGREVFKQDAVGLLFQVGTYNFTGERLFYFDPVVQFSINDECGEHDYFEQTHCELTAPPTHELEQTKCVLWSFDFATLEDFYQAVEVHPAFVLAVRHSPYSVNVFHEQV